MLNALLRKFYGYEAADEYTHRISNVVMLFLTIVACIGTVYLKNIAIPIIIIYLWAIIIGENKRYKLKRKMRDIIEKETIEVSGT